MPVESTWAIEMDIRFQRAGTLFTVEANACRDSAISLPLAAWTDGTNWVDGDTESGWSDWPDPALLTIGIGSQ